MFFNLECLSFARLPILFHSKRYKPCRKKKRRKETSDEDEKLNSLNTHEALTAPVDSSDTNTVWSECVYFFSCLIQFILTMWCIRATYCSDHVNKRLSNGSGLKLDIILHWMISSGKPMHYHIVYHIQHIFENVCFYDFMQSANNNVLHKMLSGQYNPCLFVRSEIIFNEVWVIFSVFLPCFVHGFWGCLRILASDKLASLF